MGRMGRMDPRAYPLSPRRATGSEMTPRIDTPVVRGSDSGAPASSARGNLRANVENTILA